MDGTIQILVFRLDDRQFGLRLEQIRRVIRAVDCTPLPSAPEAVSGVINFHGSILPVLNVRWKFGFAAREIGPDDQFIIARTSRRAAALVVDDVLDVADAPAEEFVPAGSFFQSLDQIEGVVVREDGMVLIHDLDRFLSLDHERALEKALEPTHGS